MNSCHVMEGMPGQSDGRIGDSGEMGRIAYYLYCEGGPIDSLGGRAYFLLQ